MNTTLQDIHPIRVLIVEDETIIAMDMQRKIKQMGCDVVGRVVSGEQAVEQARTLRPDVVLMDIKLRGKMDGITAARRIRQHDDIPVIFLSAYLAQESVRQEGASLSIAMLPKPFDPYELKEAISLIAKSRPAQPGGTPDPITPLKDPWR
jgi:CheY-like chemotaxis protein